MVEEKEEKKPEVKQEEKKVINHHKKSEIITRIKKNPWIFASIVFAIFTLVLASMLIVSNVTNKTISPKAAGAKLLAFLESNGYSNVTLNGVKEKSGLYAVNFTLKGSSNVVYLTKDGSNIAESIYSIEPTLTETKTTTQGKTSSVNVLTSDKPIVELFVMSYCPYGTQAEKGLIPVAELLGDKIDFKIRYVYYAMHGEKEIQENLREYCIQKEQESKFLPYMKCFLQGDGTIDPSYGLVMNGNDVQACLTQTKVDTTKLNACIASADTEFGVTTNFKDQSSWLNGRYPLFNVDSNLNENYNIAGSPTLVINGVQLDVSDNGYYEFNSEKITYSRSPETYKQIVCSLFKEQPEECKTTLSSANPSAYFGWDTNSSSTTSAQCG